MPDNNQRFPERAFAERPETATPLQTQQNAIKYLLSILSDPYGARILFGCASSGKSTIVQQFLSALRSDVVAARVDGAGLDAENLLRSILGQIGYRVDLESANDLFRMVSVFAIQQARTFQPPLVVIENIEHTKASGLRALSLLAGLTFQGNYAIRIALTGSRQALRLLGSDGMAPLSKRLESEYDIEPLSTHESMLVLHGRLRSCQVKQPDAILPMNVCDKIHELAGGNPGRLIEIARGTLDQALSFPASIADINKYQHELVQTRSQPKLIISSNGKVLGEYNFANDKVTIGRSSLADIVIHNQYASKFHVLLLSHADALILVDLNSANGTFVNSVRVTSTILRSDDIISFANHRIKVMHAPDANAKAIGGATMTDTTTMKTLSDMQEARKKQYLALADQKEVEG